MALLTEARAAAPSSPDALALAHARLWDAYAAPIYRFCFRGTADAELAEELTSIVFLEAWRRRDDVSLAPEVRLPWLYGVATNVLRNQRRSRRRYRAALMRLSPAPDEPDFADSLIDRLDAERQMRAIRGQLRKLSQLEQEVLSLCVWEGLAAREVATLLGVPEATVRTRLHRAREHLRTLGDEVTDAITTQHSTARQGDRS
jgi:RNA polymerase sigma factor (sigma-70 family)